ncbi:uncharacterized protein LOC131892572 [Tigriopus californicus]|uniref:uncharacterized protein LOC131892572 n=1 Tax=Tigriopus californicus TaxID=6832 RepID=UPI0027DA89E5|nr:uncharacterized protein LOC131892572 [Tigriopus californicus]
MGPIFFQFQELGDGSRGFPVVAVPVEAPRINYGLYLSAFGHFCPLIYPGAMEDLMDGSEEEDDDESVEDDGPVDDDDDGYGTEEEDDEDMDGFWDAHRKKRRWWNKALRKCPGRCRPSSQPPLC